MVVWDAKTDCADSICSSSTACQKTIISWFSLIIWHRKSSSKYSSEDDYFKLEKIQGRVPIPFLVLNASKFLECLGTLQYQYYTTWLKSQYQTTTSALANSNFQHQIPLSNYPLRIPNTKCQNQTIRFKIPVASISTTLPSSEFQYQYYTACFKLPVLGTSTTPTFMNSKYWVPVPCHPVQIHNTKSEYHNIIPFITSIPIPYHPVQNPNTKYQCPTTGLKFLMPSTKIRPSSSKSQFKISLP